jgi:hypothetical protein
MGWVLVIGAAWVGLAAVVAVLIGRTVRLADRSADDPASSTSAGTDEPNVVVDAPPAEAAGTTNEPHDTRVPTSGRPVNVRVPAPAPAPDDFPPSAEAVHILRGTLSSRSATPGVGSGRAPHHCTAAPPMVLIHQPG